MPFQDEGYSATQIVPFGSVPVTWLLGAPVRWTVPWATGGALVAAGAVEALAGLGRLDGWAAPGAGLAEQDVTSPAPAAIRAAIAGVVSFRTS